MSALAKSREDRRVRAYGPDGVLWRRAVSLEKAEHHVGAGRAVAQRHPRTGRIISIHFIEARRHPLSTRYKSKHYVHLDGRTWTHNQLPLVPVAAGLTGRQLLEQVDRMRRLVFQSVRDSVFVEQQPTPPEKPIETRKYTSIEIGANPGRPADAHKFPKAA